MNFRRDTQRSRNTPLRIEGTLVERVQNRGASKFTSVPTCQDHPRLDPGKEAKDRKCHHESTAHPAAHLHQAGEPPELGRSLKTLTTLAKTTSSSGCHLAKDSIPAWPKLRLKKSFFLQAIRRLNSLLHAHPHMHMPFSLIQVTKIHIIVIIIFLPCSIKYNPCCHFHIIFIWTRLPCMLCPFCFIY